MRVAKELSASGKGILDTFQCSFKDYQSVVFPALNNEGHLSGILFSQEHIQPVKDMMETLRNKEIHAGVVISSDEYKTIGGTNGELAMQGLDSLGKRCKEFYDLGCRFAKCKAQIQIGDGLPSEAAVRENAHTLARFASICQQNGLVPIVEPYISSEAGEYDIDTCADVSENVYSEVMSELLEQNLLLEALILNVHCVNSGVKCPEKATCDEVAAMTVQTLQRTIVPAIPLVCIVDH